MSATDVIEANVWEDGGVTLLARVTDIDGSNVQQADLSTISISVFDEDSDTPDTPVVSATALTIASVIFDTLQTDSRWSKDTTGYNFRYTLASTVCSVGRHRYRAEIKFTPASGQPFWVVYSLVALPVRSS